MIIMKTKLAGKHSKNQQKNLGPFIFFCTKQYVLTISISHNKTVSATSCMILIIYFKFKLLLWTVRVKYYTAQ